MKKYRKKPVVIEAVEYTGQNVQYILDIINLTSDRTAFLDEEKNLIIKTLEGNHKANINDYIIKGIHGEYYPCKPDIFMKTYEPVTD